MAEIDPKRFADFEVAVFNRLEKIYEGIGTLDKRLMVQEIIVTSLYGNGGEKGRVARNERAIERIKNLLWPMIGAIALLAWIGRDGLKALFT